MSLGRIGTALAMLLLLAPMAVHAASFDTIVIDDNMGGAGGNGDYAVGQGLTRQEAERIAMSNCTSGGNKACKIKVTYQQCGAYASSARTSGIGLGPTMDQASERSPGDMPRPNLPRGHSRLRGSAPQSTTLKKEQSHLAFK